MTPGARLRSHSLIRALLDFRGNSRACVYSEPLFTIPYNLYMPFFAVYMYALGLDDRMIGIVTSIGLVLQIGTALFGGLITDRLGRKRATFIFDTFSWSGALLLWTFAQDVRWFVAAAIVNAFNQVPNNSWTCLLVEDADPEHILPMYTWLNISGQLAVFFAPLSGLLVSRLGTVPAMRILLGLAFVSLTAKFVLLDLTATETTVGRARMASTRNLPVRAQFRGYGAVLRSIWHTPRTRVLLFLFVLLNMTTLPATNTLALFLTRNAGLPEAILPLVPMVRAAVMLLFLFGFQRVIARYRYRVPLITGLLLCMAAQFLLIAVPRAGLPMLLLTILLESVGAAVVWPQKDVLQTRWVDPEERARTLSLLYVLQLALTAPFGWLIGELAVRSRATVFALNAVLYLLCALIMIKEPAHDPPTAQAPRLPEARHL